MLGHVQQHKGIVCPKNVQINKIKQFIAEQVCLWHFNENFVSVIKIRNKISIFENQSRSDP